MKPQTTTSPEAILTMVGDWPQKAKYATIELTLGTPYTWDKATVRFFSTGKEFSTYYETIEAQVNAYSKDKKCTSYSRHQSF